MFDQSRLFDFWSRKQSHFARYGSIFEPPDDPLTKVVFSDVEAWAGRIILDTCRDHNLSMPVTFGIISDASMRAFASRNDEGYLIGLHAGTVVYLYNLCRAMLSCGKVFPVIGPGQTVDFDLDYNKIAIFAPVKMFQGLDNKKRDRVAYILFRQAIIWLMSHELSHIMHGHVDYCNSTGVLSVTTDPDTPFVDEEAKNINHALEIMADGSATMQTLGIACAGVNFKNAWNDRTSRFDELIPAVGNLFAIMALLRAFSPKSNISLPAYTHPSAKVRLASMVSIHRRLLERIDMPIAEADALLTRAPIGFCTLAFEHIGGQDKGPNDWAASDDVEVERAKIKAKADAMVAGDLRRYALVQIQTG
jgi:hypothetical protein